MSDPQKFYSFRKLCVLALLTGALVACGGDDDDDDADAIENQPVVVDDTVDPFTIEDKIEQAPGDEVESSFEVEGFNTPVPISIAFANGVSATYRVNDGFFTAGEELARPGDTITVRVRSSEMSEATVEAELTIGDQSDTYSVTTQYIPDFTPDEFTLMPSVEEVQPTTATDSNSVTIQGIDQMSPVTLATANPDNAAAANPMFSIDGGDFVT